MPPPTPTWTAFRSHAVLWHGCLLPDVSSIRARGVDLAFSRVALDFGRGFYTTTRREQAEEMARRKFRYLNPADRVPANRPALVRFVVPLDGLAGLRSLAFVRGDADHDSYRSFVHHCRQSEPPAANSHLYPNPDADRAAAGGYYDMVSDPLAAVWPPAGRTPIPDSDQFSFHPPAGIAILNQLIRGGPPGFAVYARDDGGRDHAFRPIDDPAGGAAGLLGGGDPPAPGGPPAESDPGRAGGGQPADRPG